MDLRFFWALPIATVFSIWPLVGQRLGVSGGLLGTGVMVTTGVATVLFSHGEYKGLSPLVLLAIAILGVLNGWGCIKYPRLVQDIGDRGGVFVATVAISIMLISVALSIPILHYRPTPRDLAGFASGTLTIWLFAGSR